MSPWEKAPISKVISQRSSCLSSPVAMPSEPLVRDRIQEHCPVRIMPVDGYRRDGRGLRHAAHGLGLRPLSIEKPARNHGDLARKAVMYTPYTKQYTVYTSRKRGVAAQ